MAEAGTAGTNFTTNAQCPQLVPPAGPYFNGPTSRISRIDHNGARTTFASGFPSAINGFGDIQGVADVAFHDGRLFALIAGGGCCTDLLTCQRASRGSAAPGPGR